MYQEEPMELDNDLQERIHSIINLLMLADLAFMTDRHELIATGLETAFEKLQYLIDDYCVKDERVEG